MLRLLNFRCSFCSNHLDETQNDYRKDTTVKAPSTRPAAVLGLDVGKQKIVLDEPIKAFGSYEIRAKLGYEVSGKFTVTVAEE